VCLYAGDPVVFPFGSCRSCRQLDHSVGWHVVHDRKLRVVEVEVERLWDGAVSRTRSRLQVFSEVQL
jgi:hypothetical protein